MKTSVLLLASTLAVSAQQNPSIFGTDLTPPQPNPQEAQAQLVKAKAAALGHTTLATTRLKFLFLAAKIWRHAGRVGVSYSDHYPEQGLFERLMNRLRTVTATEKGFAPVIATALRC